jgi:hypothetical protein
MHTFIDHLSNMHVFVTQLLVSNTTTTTMMSTPADIHTSYSHADQIADAIAMILAPFVLFCLVSVIMLGKQ